MVLFVTSLAQMMPTPWMSKERPGRPWGCAENEVPPGIHPQPSVISQQMAPGPRLEREPAVNRPGEVLQVHSPRAPSPLLLHHRDFPTAVRRTLGAACQIARRPDLHTWLKQCLFRKWLLNMYNLVRRNFRKYLLSLSTPTSIHVII